MERILLKNCLFLSVTCGSCTDGEQDVSFSGDLAIEGNTIVKVGSAGDLPFDWQPTKVIDGTGRLCLPGFVNCHSHAAMSLFRSYADDLPLMHWLEQKIWPVEAKLSGDDVFWGTCLALIEMIRTGTTTFNDMYFFMDDVARAVDLVGMRACLARGLIGTGPEGLQSLKEARQMVIRWQGSAGGRINVWLGPHAPYTCPPSYLEKVLVVAGECQAGIHIHLAETEDEVKQTYSQYGKTPVALLEALGVFRYPTVAAHCVHLEEKDIVCLAEHGVGVAHNPESNMKLASGVAPVTKLLARGVAVGIGTDGASSNNNLDMLGETRTAALLQKVATGDPEALPAEEALRLATVEGARVLRLEEQIGQLKPGFKADLILLNLRQAHWYPRHNLVSQLIYAAQAHDVETVLIDGKIVMENKKLLTIDENLVYQEVEERARRLCG